SLAITIMFCPLSPFELPLIFDKGDGFVALVVERQFVETRRTGAGNPAAVAVTGARRIDLQERFPRKTISLILDYQVNSIVLARDYSSCGFIGMLRKLLQAFDFSPPCASLQQFALAGISDSQSAMLDRIDQNLAQPRQDAARVGKTVGEENGK